MVGMDERIAARFGLLPRGRTVLDAARDRIAQVFDVFDNVVVAFSGGKDSGAMLHLVLDHMRTHRITRPIHLFHLDYEGQYSATTEYVDSVMATPSELVVPWRVCLPVAAGCAATMFADHWQPWHPAQRDLWVRPLPDHPGVVHADNVPPGFPDFDGVWDYEFQETFETWLHQTTGARRTAVLIGIRAEESLHRYATLHAENRRSTFQGVRWTSVLGPGLVKAYPIHDWRLSDVWHAHARFGWAYNRLYDLLYQAGVPAHQMRVSSPFIGQAIRQLQLYRVIEPELWSTLVGRVNGVNFSARYGATAAMGARATELPPGHTWASYLRLLLRTLPRDTRERYLAKFATSVRYWTGKGGAVPTRTVDELRALGVPADYLGKPPGRRTYTRPHEVVRFHTYPDAPPPVVGASALPSYKRMCITVLRNDHTCRYMGFSPTKRDRDRQRAIIEQYQEVG